MPCAHENSFFTRLDKISQDYSSIVLKLKGMSLGYQISFQTFKLLIFSYLVHTGAQFSRSWCILVHSLVNPGAGLVHMIIPIWTRLDKNEQDHSCLMLGLMGMTKGFQISFQIFKISIFKCLVCALCALVHTGAQFRRSLCAPCAHDFSNMDKIGQE